MESRGSSQFFLRFYFLRKTLLFCCEMFTKITIDNMKHIVFHEISSNGEKYASVFFQCATNRIVQYRWTESSRELASNLSSYALGTRNVRVKSTKKIRFLMSRLTLQWCRISRANNYISAE